MFSFIKRVFQLNTAESFDPPVVPMEDDATFSEFASMARRCEDLGISARFDELHHAYQNYRIARSVPATLETTSAEKTLADDYAHCAHELLLKTSTFVNAASKQGIEAKPAARTIIALVYDDLKARKIAS